MGALCGESEIRTRDTLLGYTRFPGVPLQPLEHLSFGYPRLSGTAKIDIFYVVASRRAENLFLHRGEGASEAADESADEPVGSEWRDDGHQAVEETGGKRLAALEHGFEGFVYGLFGANHSTDGLEEAALLVVEAEKGSVHGAEADDGHADPAAAAFDTELFGIRFHEVLSVAVHAYEWERHLRGHRGDI